MKNQNSKPITPKALQQLGKNIADKLHQVQCKGKNR